MNKKYLILLFAILGFVSCQDSSNPSSEFSLDVAHFDYDKIEKAATSFEILNAEKTGLTANNNIVETEGFNHFSWASIYNGSGVGVADFNNDGLPDIYMGQNMKSDKLYLNKGNMQFEDISGLALPEDEYWTSGVSVVDINNDGLLDIYVCKFGPTMDPEKRRNQLLVNRGNNRFRDEAKKYGLDDFGFTTQAAFFDVDKDGDKDVYIVNQPPDSRFIMQKAPTEQEIQTYYSDRLYIRNEDGKYEDKTEEYGVQNYASGLNVLVNDINEDGWLDLYVSNDYEKPDFLYINQEGKGFVNELEKRTGHISNFAMGSDVADINNDGLNDIGVLDMSSSDHYRSKTNMGSMNEDEFWANVNKGYHYQYMFNTLQLNQGRGYYSEIAQMSGIAQTDWSWSILFDDFNFDGFKDCYVTNGIKKDIRNNDFIQTIKSKITAGTREFKTFDLLNQIPSNPISNYYYESTSLLKYKDATKESGVYDPDFSSGCMVADLDRDGDYDIVTSVSENTSKILQNNTQHTSQFYAYDLDKSIWNEFMYASFVFETNFGTQRKDFIPARGYLSSSWDRVLIGVPNEATILQAYVTTIYGDSYTLPLNAGENTILSKDNLKKMKSKDNNQLTLFTPSNSLKYTHKENSYNDFSKELLLPHKLSEAGPCTVLFDTDGDGVEELFVGGSIGNPVSQFKVESGAWKEVNSEFWSNYTEFENRNFTVLDKDNDGDLDLLVVNGGNDDTSEGRDWLEDQLFENDGKGNFTLTNDLPSIKRNTVLCIPIDIDGDKDDDLVLFGGHKIGRYPDHESSIVLENKEGKFVQSDELGVGFEEIGIVSDAVKMDFNDDGFEDIVLVGSWSNPILLSGNGSKLRFDTPESFNDLSSWWESIQVGDFNGDGRQDLVLGSFGENNKFHPSKKKPLEIYGNDFDGSGTNDVVLAKHYKDKVVPTRGRECSSQQIPNIKEKFPTFDGFALAGIEEIFGEDELESGVHKVITGMSHKILWNTENGWVASTLPEACQLSPLKSMKTLDVNNDGIQDIIGLGNHHGAEVETARYDAGFGWILLGADDMNLKYVPAYTSGLMLSGDGRSLEIVKRDNKTELLAFFNNGPSKSYILN